MTAAELKASILDLAIRGKLVAQDLDDEPASELLARIAAEKAKLIREKKIKKEKPLAPITEDEVPVELPSGWAWCRLGEISEGVGSRENQILAKEVKEQGAVPVVSQGQNLIDGYSDEVLKAVSDVPVVMFGDHTRNVKYVDFPFVIGADGTKFFKSFVDTKWLYYWTCYQSDQIRDRGYGRHWGLLNAKVVALPPLAEQKRIVEMVEELMPLVDRYEKAEAKRIELERALPGDLEKSILQEAIQGKLVEQDPDDEPASELLARIAAEKAKLIKEKKLKKEKPLAPITEDEKPFELPKGWAWCRVGSVCDKLVDGDHNPPKGVGAKTPYLMLSSLNINNDQLVELDRVRYLDEETFKKEDMRTAARAGDIFFTSVATLGRSCIYDGGKNLCFQRSVTVLHPLIDGRFLKRVFDSPYFQKLVDDQATGTAQRGFYIQQFTRAVIPIPPLAEQRRIVAKVDELLGAIRRLH